MWLPLAPAVNRLLRWLWSHTAHSRSTWFDSRRWRAVWNVNRWFAVVPRVERELVQVRFSPAIRMELDLSRLTDVLAFCYGPGELEVGHACARLCPRDGVVVDVGGNIGTTALSFAASVPRGHVHVFEPSREMLPILRRNLELSAVRNVSVHAFGLSDAPSRGRLQVATAGNPGSAFFVVDGVDRVAPPAVDRIEVKCLDEVLAAVPRLDFVKIDVEGYELRVLRGAAALLARHRPAVLFEVNESALQRAATSGREVCDFLLERGYRLQYLHRGQFRDYDPATMLQRKLHNVIALPAEFEPRGA
ncbi:MAG: FkbM family methyltransferase [Planctomycetota bacterium]